MTTTIKLQVVPDTVEPCNTSAKATETKTVKEKDVDKILTGSVTPLHDVSPPKHVA